MKGRKRKLSTSGSKRFDGNVTRVEDFLRRADRVSVLHKQTSLMIREDLSSGADEEEWEENIFPNMISCCLNSIK